MILTYKKIDFGTLLLDTTFRALIIRWCVKISFCSEISGSSVVRNLHPKKKGPINRLQNTTSKVGFSGSIHFDVKIKVRYIQFDHPHKLVNHPSADRARHIQVSSFHLSTPCVGLAFLYYLCS